MFGKAIDDISTADLQALVDNGIPEGRRLEFKRDHYGKKEEDKREFAADVSAMANAMGGYLLIGIAEENGIASKVTGVDAENPDALVRAVSDSIRTSIEPPILGVRVRWVDIEAGRGVLIIQVDRSWDAPHRVTVKRDNCFYLRGDNGKHSMSVTELRRAFLFASEVEDRIRRFRSERLQLLIANEGPLAVNDSGPRLVLHVVPQAAFTGNIQLRFGLHETGISPLGGGGHNSMHSLDGFVTYSGPEERFESVRAFATLFRNGIVEALAGIYTVEQNGRREIGLSLVEQDVISQLQHILQKLQQLSVPRPYYLMLSLVGVRGQCAVTNEWRSDLAFPCRSDKMLLPEFMIDDGVAKGPLVTFLRPLLDLMWNGFGRRGSPNYDRDGNYRPR